MNAVPPPPSLGGSRVITGRPHHAHGQGTPVMPAHGTSVTSQKERSIRSIFVGNIPYEATQEQLTEIFSEVGPVVNFRLVVDKTTGRPKGYGFCEYQDPETAASAVRNLATRELHGRVLRVDSSANAKLQQKQDEEIAAGGGDRHEMQAKSAVGPVDPADAPKVIAEAVGRLSARQAFDLLTQLKNLAQNFPEDAHQLLASNPHVAYAGLLAQVSVGLIEPDVAEGLLHPPRPPPSVLWPLPQTQSLPTQNTFAAMHRSPAAQVPMRANQQQPVNSYERESRGSSFGRAGDMHPSPQQPSSSQFAGHRGSQPESNFGPRGPRQQQRPTSGGVQSRPPPGHFQPPTPAPSQQLPVDMLQLSQASGLSPGSDKEKAELIMQVLNLTDQDMQLLTPEQRESVMTLKQQVSSAVK